MSSPRKLSLTALIVGLALVLGGAARIYRLADRSYKDVQRISAGPPIQHDISVPGLPQNLSRILVSDLFYRRHPPGYDLMMFLITWVFGPSPAVMVLPSFLFSVASIGLVYWLGLLIGQRVPGCIAALLLAFNGYQVFMSQTTGPYSLVCSLSLLATILLVLLSQEIGSERGLESCYAVVLLLGLFCQHCFWALLAIHMLWVLANAWVQDRRLPRLLNIQILVMILGSPLLAVATLQSRNQATALTANALVMAREYALFYWFLPGFNELLTGRTIARLSSPTVDLAFRALLCVFCVWLFVIGSRRLSPVDDPTLSAPSKPFIGLWILATVLATLADVGLIFATRRQVAHNPGIWLQTLPGVEALAVLPSILFMAAIALLQSWLPLRVIGRKLQPRALAGGQRLILLLAIMPFAVFLIASIPMEPFLSARDLLFVAPYLLLALACGIFAIGRRSRSLAIALFLVLAALHSYSLWAYSIY